MGTPYTRYFYTENKAVSRPSADEVVPLLMQLIAPRSVLDVGCGVGTWLAAFREQGVADVVGMDGAYVDQGMLQIPAACFVAHDLATPLPGERRFDLVLCLEVAEHIVAAQAARFVQDLTRRAPVVVCSAAVPGQGGWGHVNEQWPAYWADLFGAQGFTAIDCLRPRIWDNPRVQYWYAQNLLVFASEEGLAGCPALQQARTPCDTPVRALIHPEAWRRALDPRQADLWQTLRCLPHAVANGVRARVSALIGNRSTGGGDRA